MNLTSPLGVCVLGSILSNQPNCTYHSNYITEILEHAGVPFSQIELAELSPELKILITVGDTPLEENEASALRQWMQNGGCWLSLGNVCGLGEVHGAEEVPSPRYGAREFVYAQSTLGEGYLQPSQKHPALVESTFGDGHTLFLAPDAVGAIVRISHGSAVTADGIPAPDGSAPTADGVLKCDDGLALDWEFDRQEIPGVPGLKGFFEPVADQWREVILRGIFYLAEKATVALPLHGAA